MLNLLHGTSKEVQICVKSPVGITEKDTIRDIILQGETVCSLICTKSVDLISKEYPLSAYKYREIVDIPKLSFVDDIADVTKCAERATEMNEYTCNEINKRKLQLATDKCHKMHIGKSKECSDLTKEEWKVEKEKEDGVTKLIDKYFGKSSIETVDSKQFLRIFVAGDETNTKTIDTKVGRCHCIINDIVNIIVSVPLGKYFFETAVIVRSSLFISVLTHDIEVLHNLTKNKVKKPESIDNQLLSKNLETSTKTSVCVKRLE